MAQRVRSAAVGAAVAIGAAAAAEPAAAQAPAPDTVARTCLVCHAGPQPGQQAMPQLVGLPADYIATALLEYRADQRSGTIMNRIAKGYDEATLRAVAAQLAKP